MDIGFTGTRKGMTLAQRKTLWEFLYTISHFHPVVQARHGDCIGADTEFHMICDSLSFNVTIHPPISRQYRSFNNLHFPRCVVLVRPELPFHRRNREIVSACDFLIATPKEDLTVIPNVSLAQRLAGGTWMTVNYARHQHKDVHFILPNGNHLVENNSVVVE